MGLVGKLALAVMVASALQPALAQTPSRGAMPAGTQNPAVAQPQLVAPPPPARLSTPPAPQPQPQPLAPSAAAGPQTPGSMIIPGGAGGLCECLVNHDPTLTVFDKTKMHQSCMANVDACQAACNTQHFFSWVPHAVYTCPARPGEGQVAMNTLPASRLLGRR